ncbi:MAG: AAA family ATPase [Clostridia bacterium]|nr:AAA family ATPase [Clostridia bacterium]
MTPEAGPGGRDPAERAPFGRTRPAGPQRAALDAERGPSAGTPSASVSAGLDERWLEQAMLKRRANYSPVICFETADPRRLLQLKEYVRTHEDLRQAEHVFLFDLWQGLSRMDASGRFAPYRKAVAESPLQRYGTADGAGVQLASLKQALREIDGFLRRHRTVAILQNLAENREWETGLQGALRSWAIDEDVLAHASTVFVQTADASALLDAYTRELVVVVEVDPSSDAERAFLIGKAAAELEVALSGDRLGELVAATAGLNLHQVESILLESYHATRDFDLTRVKDLKSDLVRRSRVLDVAEPNASFRDIGGYEAVKRFVARDIVRVLKEAGRAQAFGVPLPRGILLFGPPGTGKSLFARALAHEVHLPFMHLHTENIYSKWFGESGQNMRQALTLIDKMSPAVVFVDEIDRFGRRSGAMRDSAGEESQRVFSQFLEWLGHPEREAIVVGTTNVPDHLDEAFIRTGRFDYKVPFLYPGAEARLAILKVHLGLVPGTRRRRPPLLVDEAELVEHLAREVVPKTRFFTGAELEELVTRAKRRAFASDAQGVAPDDFISAAESFRVPVDERRANLRYYLEQVRRFTDDRAFVEELEEEAREGD